MDQARLRLLQLSKCRLGGVSRRTDGLLSMFALSDVAINQHEATARHGIAAYLNDLAVGPRALVAHLQPGVVDRAAELRFEIGRDELAPISEVAEKIGPSRPFSEDLFEQSRVFDRDNRLISKCVG